MDLIFQFFLMHQKRAYSDGTVIMQWETRLGPIAKKYMTSPYFTLDVCSIAPSSFDIYGVVVGQSSLASLKSLRVIRVLRLIKLCLSKPILNLFCPLR